MSTYYHEELEVTLNRHEKCLRLSKEEVKSFRIVIGQDFTVQDEFLEENSDELESNRDNKNNHSRLIHGKIGFPLTCRLSLSCCCCIILFFITLVILITIWRIGVFSFVKTRIKSGTTLSSLENKIETPTIAPFMLPSETLRYPSSRPSISTAPSSTIPSLVPSSSSKPSNTPYPTEVSSTYPSQFPTSHTTIPSLYPTSPSTRSAGIPTILNDKDSLETRVCNGLASNCNMRANDIMYATSHNAMSSQEDGFIAFNHLLSLEDSLEAGFRGFLLDSCDCGEIEGVKFCHEFCFSGSREVEPVFLSILSFLNRYPHDIIVLELQVNDNSLWRLWEQVPQQFKDVIYSHASSRIEWPTLNEMIDMGKRAIVFHHNGPNCDEGLCPEGVQTYVNSYISYILISSYSLSSIIFRFWKYGFETEWDLTTVKDIADYDLSCRVRTGNSTRPNTFMLNNHFSNSLIGLPSRLIAEEINNQDFLQSRLDACTSLIGRRTNLLAVDFWSIGDVMEVVNRNNEELAGGDNIFQHYGNS
jgi:hypothetical protein